MDMSWQALLQEAAATSFKRPQTPSRLLRMTTALVLICTNNRSMS